MSRPLALCCCVWLLVSWAVNLTIDPPTMEPRLISGNNIRMVYVPHAFVPAVQGMMLSIMLGIGLAWPMWRLSQRRAGPTGAATAADVIMMVVLAQLVIWPMRLLAGWTLGQTLLTMLIIAVWSAAAGVCVWMGRLRISALDRVAAMVATVALLLGGSIAAWLGLTGAAGWSPLSMLWNVADVGGHERIGAIGRRLAMVAAAVTVIWAAVLLRRHAAQDQAGRSA